MSDARQLEVLIEQANAQRRLGNHRAAIELLQRALALDPDHAHAHGTLALALLSARRLPAAAIEMRAALHLDGNDPFVHYVAAAVQRASRKLDDAWAHCAIALDTPDADADTRVLGAEIVTLKGDRARARQLLDEALEHDPSHTGALTAMARWLLDDGDLAAARDHVTRALHADPVDRRAHVVAGFIDLAQGDAAGAEGHARFVLNQNATDQAGLELWTAIKARRSPVIGAWWRWNTWVSLRDERSQIAVMIAAFVLMRIAIIVTDELGYDTLSRVLSLAWLGLCAYTWFAPVLFRRWLAAELGAVALDPEF